MSGFLAALQLGDSALPIGRFAHSGGLEALLALDTAAGEDAIVELVESVVLESVGPLDGVAVAQAHRAAAKSDLDGLLELDRRVTCRKLSPASRLASTSCGRRLAALADVLTDDETVAALCLRVAQGTAEGNLAVVEGALAAAMGMSGEDAVLVELRNAASALLSAAVRLGRLSAVRAQAALRRLEPALLEAATAAQQVPASAMRSTAPEVEIAAMAHLRAAPRLFAT